MIKSRPDLIEYSELEKELIYKNLMDDYSEEKMLFDFSKNHSLEFNEMEVEELLSDLFYDYNKRRSLN